MSSEENKVFWEAYLLPWYQDCKSSNCQLLNLIFLIADDINIGREKKVFIMDGNKTEFGQLSWAASVKIFSCF